MVESPAVYATPGKADQLVRRNTCTAEESFIVAILNQHNSSRSTEEESSKYREHHAREFETKPGAGESSTKAVHHAHHRTAAGQKICQPAKCNRVQSNIMHKIRTEPAVNLAKF